MLEALGEIKVRGILEEELERQNNLSPALDMLSVNSLLYTAK